MTKVAIVIPTLNRSEILLAQLKYYRSRPNFSHAVYIGDSSSGEHFEKNKINIQKLNIGLEEKLFFHIPCPNMNESYAVIECLKHSKENFSVYNGDDDYLVPEAVSKCADFLKSNPQYSGCHGDAALVTIQDFIQNEIVGVNPYPLGEVLLESPVDRVLYLMENYFVSIFCIQRKESMLKNYELTAEFDSGNFREITQCLMVCAIGKIKSLSGLYLIRVAHPKRYLLPGFIDWITREDWRQSYLKFRRLVVCRLTDANCELPSNFEQHLDKGFEKYLSIHFRKFHKKITDQIKVKFFGLKRRVNKLRWKAKIPNREYQVLNQIRSAQ
ncbi:MAG: TIGR00180 family glycosyltransferase [Halobacteriovoraceae bacterium]|nr:TIGR00180 family glycosyltransferase [Halobacteriovoraceae bacterium]